MRVHRSERADLLVAALGDLLAGPPGDPMAREVVSVPTRGVERWLTQRLSHRLGVGGAGSDGVCANIDFPFPGVLVGSAAALACGFDPEDDPWPPERSVWPLVEIVDAHMGEPWLAELAAHLRDSAPSGAGTGRRFATLRHLADLYDRYAVHRPEMVRAWVAGNGGGDGAAGAGGWQAELWRRLREHIGVPSPAERLLTAAARLTADPGLLDLPERLSLFGLTRLPASHLQVLDAVAAGRDVHLFLLHPSGALWDKVAVALAAEAPVPVLRAVDPTRKLATNPLLRSWGRDAREMQVVLASYAGGAGGAGGAGTGDYRPVADDPRDLATLLARIQADVRADRVPHDPIALGPTDDSLQVHACHGRARQVEVVRDAVLHLLAQDETLEPRDVIVMCPDIEAFAPLVHAAFGVGETAEEVPGRGASGGAAGPPALRVRLADRSLRQTNPLLAVAALLLDLAGQRVRASEVLDLVSREPVARRFGFDEDDLAQIERWVGATGIRWGLDGAHRALWSLSAVEANTWRSGLDRLMLGVAMAEDDQRLFADVLPHDDVSSTGVDLAGRFCELIDRLGATLDGLTGPQGTGEWIAALVSGTERLAMAAEDDRWQHDQLHRVFGEVVAEAVRAGAARAGPAPVMERSEISALLTDRLRGRPTRANFRTGDLTICTLVPMRSVPHRVVCLLGLDDGVFPRHAEEDGDDLLLSEPMVGDRDGRSEDRQLLLDALLAATEHLVITYEGRDQRTNQVRPPAVPVAELLDVVDRTARHWKDGRRARDAVIVAHPLQSFDPRNFEAGRLTWTGPWSFDPVNLAAARVLQGEERRARRPFLDDRLPALDRPVIQLDSLIRFVEHPIRAFLRERLGLYLGSGPDQIRDGLPVEVDPLERWGVGQRILDARLAGADANRALAAERGRGLLPPDPLDSGVLGEVIPTVEALVQAVGALPCSKIDAESLEVNLRLPDGRLLMGTVPGVRDNTILRCIFSTLGPRHRLAVWTRFLALAASMPERGIEAFTLGRGPAPLKRGPSIATSRLAFTGTAAERGDAALTALSALVALYDRGMREPLPIYCKTSAAWAEGRLTNDDQGALYRARDVWHPDHEDSPVPGEDADPAHVLVLGDTVGFDVIRQEGPRDHDLEGWSPSSGWPEGERSRFGGFAVMLWRDLRAAEQ